MIVVGLTEEGARHQDGFETVAASANSRSKHSMIPGVKPWTIKLVFDRQTHKLMGGKL